MVLPLRKHQLEAEPIPRGQHGEFVLWKLIIIIFVMQLFFLHIYINSRKEMGGKKYRRRLSGTRVHHYVIEIKYILLYMLYIPNSAGCRW